MMKKYFAQKNATVVMNADPVIIEAYKSKLIDEMKKMGARDSDFAVVCDTLIVNSIFSSREPEDVAWAILQ